MTPHHPTRAALGLAGACALLVSVLHSHATEPLPAPVVTSASQALNDIEAQAPRDMSDPAAVAAHHARVLTLVEGNFLQTPGEFRRAALLLYPHFGERRVVRTQYELLLAAAGQNDGDAERMLADFWDMSMGAMGRPQRFDFRRMVERDPEFVEVEAAPACIAAVWRDPAAARAAVAGVADNAELQALFEADQADRRGNWVGRTPEEQAASRQRDRERNARVRTIIAADDVRTATDFRHAGFLMQHSALFGRLQLAHELAVASLLLGDRQSGRWLVTASYDRMLRTAGFEQRFGTQFNATGLLPVDEAGLCDNQRLALGCPTLAQSRSRKLPGS